nr:universal stress protein [Haloarchaeobius litoreus]
MGEELFTNVLVPVASEDDARASIRAALPYLAAAGGTATLVHVIEKAGGAPDKASVEQREEYAAEIFDAAWEEADDALVELHREIIYGTDVAESIIDAGDELDASAIVFTPRGSSRWVKLLTGDVALGLVEHSDRPVIVLPDEA